jgi:adenine deaminase
MARERLVLANANVIDCVGERPMAGGSVVIERGRIAEVLDGTRSADTAMPTSPSLKGVTFRRPLGSP